MVDGCFVVELLRELQRHGFKHGSKYLSRWMLPVLRRDLIMLENQLPFFVLSKLFELTSNGSITNSSLRQLSFQFFNPLMPRISKTPGQDIVISKGIEANHFLDLFRSSILPRNMKRGKEDDVIHPVTKLREGGIIIEVSKACRPLGITSEVRVLKIPTLYIDDYRGTLFRNLVAYEQCHGSCKPDVTTFLFFFDGLINSAKDVHLLHHRGVLHHSSGCNKDVARLVNRLYKEVPREADESYLYEVVYDANSFLETLYAKVRGGLVRHYFSNWVVGVSTFAAAFALYLTLVQTGSGVASAADRLHSEGFGAYLKDSILLPIFGKPSFKLPNGSPEATVQVHQKRN